MDAEGQVEVGDDRIVKVIVRMRAALAELSKEYAAAEKVIKDQKEVLEAELLKRLHARGATQTKTNFGTAFIGEAMTVNIADEDIFRKFVLDTADLEWYQRRVSVAHLREYQNENEGRTPPGLSTFREATINIRTAKEKS